MINKIYLHWTAGRYDQFFNDYHICIDGDGVVHKMADFETKLAHTWQRNSNAVGIALCCCYGASITRAPLRIKNEELKMKNCGKDGPEEHLSAQSGAGDRLKERVGGGGVWRRKDYNPPPSLRSGAPLTGGTSQDLNFVTGYEIDWGEYPPTKEQILSMAHCVADICKQYNLPVNKDTVMTHAEVADMDGYGLHDNDPDLRWDLLRLSTTGNVPGGDVIRNIAKVLIREEVVEPQSGSN